MRPRSSSRGCNTSASITVSRSELVCVHVLTRASWTFHLHSSLYFPQKIPETFPRTFFSGHHLAIPSLIEHSHQKKPDILLLHPTGPCQLSVIAHGLLVILYYYFQSGVSIPPNSHGTNLAPSPFPFLPLASLPSLLCFSLLSTIFVFPPLYTWRVLHHA